MQWGQIKTLFIVSFLILDLFLLQQFLSKQDTNELTTLSPSQEELEDMDIDLSNVPEEKPILKVMKAKPDEFAEENIEEIHDLDQDQQEYKIIDDRLLVSVFKDPIKIDEDNVTEQVSKYVPFASQYSYWTWNKEKHVIIFFQKANNHTIYYNKGGALIIKVDDGKMTKYSASLLNISDEEFGEQADLIAPIAAVQQLRDSLSKGDEITEMNLGYYSNINLNLLVENGAQVFNPTWKITVNGEDEYFVDALKGTLLSMDEGKFIDKSIATLENNTKDPTDIPKPNNERSSNGESQ
ncbi:two-component system regulatory protein YycI [Halobacillus salinarum]|uniref:Two-component system regulatory protein YycI n=1 Tax=Halobacillus salinarum TaxID=2932257 RepID=A0ABY4EJZ9_9BACI|nr:two-component system regulatory protein YycI [Halobacillus salinarum]UOQ44799.1 two-component system regulatory protein YycI [Halobacillus salinarum]